MKGKYDYEVKMLNPISCELKLVFGVSNRVFKLAFEGALRAKGLKKQLGGDFSKVTVLDVPEHFYKLLATGVNGCVKDLNEKVFAKDGFKVLHYDVKKAVYRSVDKVWLCELLLEGNCVWERDLG